MNTQIVDSVVDENNIDVLKRKKEHIEQRSNSIKFRVWLLLIFVFIGGLLGYSYISFTQSNSFHSGNQTISSIIIGSIICGISYFYISTMLRLFSQNGIRRIEYRLIQFGADELKENIDEDFLLSWSR